ncbi:hypothetical protein FSP39_008375 [Pinctada imbricata]|uniref:Glypican-5 n=1 Tax=Pinctada imbricata TaxID=66713 RepID=A0AA88Y2Y9_PINIB|nr:hypothetical protein FSP39_008375 [Pinctada imbricata]
MKMPNINPFQCLICVIVWTFGLSLDTDHECHRVKQEFLHRGIGSSHLVPDNPVYDKNISICFNAASRNSNQKTCCTRDMELKYKIAAGKYLTNSIKSKNAHLKKLVMDHLLEYQERVEELVVRSENNTAQLLSDIYRIPRTQHQAIVNEFYGNIRTYLRHKHVSIYGAVNTFFDSIFPFVYSSASWKQPASILSEEHKTCLRQSRQDIVPKPFKTFPNNISHGLNRAFSISKSYVDVLSLIVEAINTTDYLNVTEKCQDRITRLQYCSQCQGHVSVKPCKGLCLNSMRQCLAQFSVISEEWSGLVTAMVRLEGGVSQTNSIERMLGDLDTFIDRAIDYAKVTYQSYMDDVQKLCNYKVTVPVERTPPSKLPIRTSKLPIRESRTKRSFTGSLYERVLEVKKELLNARKMFDTFADDICDGDITYEQDYNSTTCWNGLEVGKYNFDVEDLSTLLKSALVIDPSLVVMKDKLTHMRINLMTRYPESDLGHSMMADSRREGSGYNGYLHIGHGTVIGPTDDEDMVDGSGSGSGSGDGNDNVDINIDKGFVDPEDPGTGSEVAKPGSAADHSTVKNLCLALMGALSGYMRRSIVDVENEPIKEEEDKYTLYLRSV